MPHHGQVSSDEEIKKANWEGFQGGINGAARWGVVAGVFGIGAYCLSPVYRNLTFQFKLYLQMSMMTVGGMIEGERRVRDYETHARRWRKFKRDQEIWQTLDEQYETEARKEADASNSENN